MANEGFRLPPGVAAAVRETLMTAGRIGYRALSAAIAEGLKGVGEITAEVDGRVKRGAQAAEEMAKTGKTYREVRKDRMNWGQNDEEGNDDDSQ